jgi:glucose dehydrogenase
MPWPRRTKQGFVFVFDRVTGVPLFPVELPIGTREHSGPAKVRVTDATLFH